MAKGFGTKSYDLIRISVITNTSEAPVQGFFDYSSQFKGKWTQNYLHTAMKRATPGQDVMFDLGVEVPFRLPVQGAGVAGVLIADPCVNTGVHWQICSNGDRYQTLTRTPGLINTFVADPSTDFWGILGDNFYDRTGEITAAVYERISLAAKSKLFVTVAGNHDYWARGQPDGGSYSDQCGRGHMQYYAQDAKVAESIGEGSSVEPFNHSDGPGGGGPCTLPPLENHFWYNQVGNVGMVGQSGVYSLADAKPFMAEACAWLGTQRGLDVAILLGHWDAGGLGADDDMAMPSWYEEMSKLPGCDAFEARGMLKFFQGHTHCNDPHPHGKVDAGFRVAGQGMSGCSGASAYGIPIVDTTADRVRVWYFAADTEAKYDAVVQCVQKKGWRQCTDLAVSWLDQPVVPATEFTSVV